MVNAYENLALLGEAENKTSSPSQINSVDEATAVTPPLIDKRFAVGVRLTSILTLLLSNSHRELAVVLTVILLKKVSVDNKVVGV